jgi:signal transduction histidine kinase
MRLRRPRFGLRGKLVGALVATAAVTLIGAALALLSPLEQRLRTEELKSLTATAAAGRGSFADLERDQLRPGNHAVARLARGLQRRTGARVVVLTHGGTMLYDSDPDESLHGLVPIPRTAGAPLARLREVGGERQATVVVPTGRDPTSVVVVAAKPLDDVTTAVAVVQRAILVAALAGLATALLVGIALASTLARRLRRLRRAAIELDPHAERSTVPHDGARDEVGDLSRSLSAMSDRLRREEKARETFVSTASHELRTPLASLDGMIELLGDDLRTNPPDLDHALAQVARLREHSRRLGALAAELLDLSRLDAGVELRHELIDAGEVARAVVAEFSVRAAERGVELGLELPPAPCWVIADPGAVARILRILLDNALRHSPPGGRVGVSVAGGQRVRIAIADDGPGVPEAERSVIFERFRRGAHAEAGFGLGLALGRELSERMGGQLDLDGSQRGARFVAELQGAPDPGLPVQQPASE